MATFSTQLAHLLASHEKEQRDQGVMLIERWLAGDYTFTSLDLLKAWKALFFCFWHSDKPLVQHELARRLAKSQHLLKGDNCILHMGAFWTTMNREWGNIDRIRLDKFLAFVRYFVNESLQFIARAKYNPEVMEAVLEALSSGPLSPSEGTANGLRLHVADIFCDELEKVFEDQNFMNTSSELLVSMLKPFFTFAASCINRVVLTNVLKSLFNNFIYKWREMLANPPEEMDEQTKAVHVEKVTEHVHAFSAKLFEVASAKETSDISRPLIYKQRKNLEKYLMDLERRGLKKRKFDDEEKMNGIKATSEPPSKKQKRDDSATTNYKPEVRQQKKEKDTVKNENLKAEEQKKNKKSAKNETKEKTEMKKAVSSVLSPTLRALLNEVDSDSADDEDEDESFEAMEVDEDDYVIHEDSDSSEDIKETSKKALKKSGSDKDKGEDSDEDAMGLVEEMELMSEEEDDSKESDSGFDMEDNEEDGEGDELLDEEGLRKLIVAMSKGGRKQPLIKPGSPRTPAAAVFSRKLMGGTPPIPKNAKSNKMDLASAPSTPGGTKKVKFNLRANQSVDLETIELGRSPYRPDAKPVGGILRTPGSVSKKSSNGTNRARVSSSTPTSPAIVSSAMKQKKRPVAADFF